MTSLYREIILNFFLVLISIRSNFIIKKIFAKSY